MADSVEEILALLREGARHRVIAATTMNRHSSRGHTLFSVTVRRRWADADGHVSLTKQATLTFVDLAGSERIHRSGSNGATLEEAKDINKSLSALGSVIAALSQASAAASRDVDVRHRRRAGGGGGDASAVFVPWRETKLTRLLHASLQGTCSLTLVVNLSPADSHAGETRSSLLFAARARGLYHRPGEAGLAALGKELGLEPSEMLALGVGGTHEFRALAHRLQQDLDEERDRRRQEVGSATAYAETLRRERDGALERAQQAEQAATALAERVVRAEQDADRLREQIRKMETMRSPRASSVSRRSASPGRSQSRTRKRASSPGGVLRKDSPAGKRAQSSTSPPGTARWTEQRARERSSGASPAHKARGSVARGSDPEPDNRGDRMQAEIQLLRQRLQEAGIERPVLDEATIDGSPPGAARNSGGGSGVVRFEEPLEQPPRPRTPEQSQSPRQSRYLSPRGSPETLTLSALAAAPSTAEAWVERARLRSPSSPGSKAGQEATRNSWERSNEGGVGSTEWTLERLASENAQMRETIGSLQESLHALWQRTQGPSADAERVSRLVPQQSDAIHGEARDRSAGARGRHATAEPPSTPAPRSDDELSFSVSEVGTPSSRNESNGPRLPTPGLTRPHDPFAGPTSNGSVASARPPQLDRPRSATRTVQLTPPSTDQFGNNQDREMLVGTPHWAGLGSPPPRLPDRSRGMASGDVTMRAHAFLTSPEPRPSRPGSWRVHSTSPQEEQTATKVWPPSMNLAGI